MYKLHINGIANGEYDTLQEAKQAAINTGGYITDLDTGEEWRRPWDMRRWQKATLYRVQFDGRSDVVKLYGRHGARLAAKRLRAEYEETGLEVFITRLDECGK